MPDHPLTPSDARPWPGERLAQWLRRALGFFGVAAPVVYLGWQRGGVDVSDQAAVFCWVLTLTALTCLWGHRLGARPVVPWPALVLPLIPLLQIAPLGWGGLDSLWRIEISREVTRLGVDPGSASSIYPYATLRASVMVAGCCGLYVLARAASRRSRGTVWVIVAPLVILGVVEAVLGIGQYLRGLSLDDGEPWARGTLVNRGHYAALLEGCFGLTLGLGLSFGGRSEQNPWRAWYGAGLCFAAAAVCVLAIVLSFSRAGILTAALIAAAACGVAAMQWRAGALVAVGMVALTGLLGSAIGGAGLAGRFVTLAEGGDPFRMRLWGDTLQGARDYFWTGSGVGTFAFAFRRPAMYLPLKTIDHAHSDYLETLVELGVPAALFLLSVLAFFWARTAWRIAEAASHRRRMLAMGCWLGASGILLHAAVDFPLRIPAVAALAAVLAGMASGLSASRQRQRPLVRFAAGAEAAVFLALSLGLLLGAAEDKNAETLFARGSAAMAGGQWEEAERLYLRALEANPFAAAVWLKRAEIAELQGDRRGALEMATLAQRLEPYTLRVEWPLAHLYLRGGDFEKAAVPLNRLATGLPSSRAAVFEAAWRARMDPPMIARSVVPRNGEAIGEYLCYLVRQSAWSEIAPAYQELNPEGAHEVPAKLRRYTFDKLFAAGANREAEQLRQLVQRSGGARVGSTP